MKKLTAEQLELVKEYAELMSSMGELDGRNAEVMENGTPDRKKEWLGELAPMTVDQVRLMQWHSRHGLEEALGITGNSSEGEIV